MLSGDSQSWGGARSGSGDDNLPSAVSCAGLARPECGTASVRAGIDAPPPPGRGEVGLLVAV